MITMKFEAMIGFGLRQRVVMPAITALTRPVLIVAPSREVLHCNWPDIPADRKMTLMRFLKEEEDGMLDARAVVIVDHVGMISAEVGEKLMAMRSEVWVLTCKP